MVNRKFNKAIFWNYISLVIMAASGLSMNAVIALFYGSAVLGAFGETYAWYMILSQLSVWGIHMSIVKHVPETNNPEEKGALLKSGIAITIVTSLLVTIASEFVVCFLSDVAWKRSMQVAFLGLVFFSVNKVFLNYLNAIYKMVAYSIFTSIRYAILAIGMIVLSLGGTESDYIALIFPLTEIIVFLGMLGYFFFRIPVQGKLSSILSKKMLCFGTKILPSYMVLEMNTKVDMVCLGMLVSDVSQIGIYSFAIFFTEGFYMLFVIIRKIVNPGIAEANIEGKISERIAEMKRYLHRYVILGGGAAYLGVIIGYVILCSFMQRPAYRAGVMYIIVICFSIAVNGKYIVFGDLLAQIGYPLEESVLNIVTVTGNFILNIILIMVFGMLGAAIATAVSYFVFSFYMKVRVKERVGITL